MKNILLFIVFISVSPSVLWADQKYNCENPQGGYETGYCSGLKFEKADKELNVVYKQLKKLLNTEEKQLLLKSQRGWINLKENYCDLENYENRDTTGWQTGLNECWEKFTIQRIEELKLLLSFKTEIEEPTY